MITYTDKGGVWVEEEDDGTITAYKNYEKIGEYETLDDAYEALEFSIQHRRNNDKDRT